MNELMLFFLSFFGVLLLLYPFENLQRKNKIGQFIREEGPDLHNHKTGTPTSAGLVFIPVVLLAVTFFSKDHNLIIPVTTGVLFGIVGAMDDLAKLIKRNSSGISALTRLILEFFIAFFIVYMIQRVNPHTHLLIPFSKKSIDIGFLYFPFAMTAIVGTANAVNITDGVDGLAGSVYIASVFPLIILGYHGSLYSALIGALLGFLWHNWYPAKVFMGDTGSLSLGGILAASLAMTGREIYLFLFGFIFVVETLSDIIQVGSFKLRNKRVFKMAPVHHHFELLGWHESKIAFRFSIIALGFSLLGLLGWRGYW
ncbi:phospho-N-acetylmuramoyl-pentapeptide-transferase [Kosmotoga arenicorallina S304]|uniref:Phospho-N-acetylmuramoyl-pentapeptide-transferase n=1 Tax=Kosmotoga arenicorallina S304 TaxID=1453497 RepID=A0A176K2Z8_9BACT|nr:phospho-N-acetylmuramoyl-pentapeptide-transferase [Kosmotoga arenicorallina]OAA31418.1 phospho-N-acetylmuramoyl-pentapeptide-transferase [Kosmotoga arenicorallina S304]